MIKINSPAEAEHFYRIREHNNIIMKEKIAPIIDRIIETFNHWIATEYSPNNCDFIFKKFPTKIMDREEEQLLSTKLDEVFENTGWLCFIENYFRCESCCPDHCDIKIIKKNQKGY